MLYFKLIRRSLGKNLSNYLIYFLTVTLSISLFYAFNSISQQQAFSGLSTTKALLYNQLNLFISLLSVIIGAVLAFLMIYANAFMLKRRKKELGIYTLLGMGRLAAAAVFTVETGLTGLLALGAGVALGVVLAQVLSVVALRLFAVPLDMFRFVFSPTALRRTLLCFLAITAVMMLANALIISRSKLVDLITAPRKNEVYRPAPTPMLLAGLFAAAAALAGCFYLIESKGLLPAAPKGDAHLQLCALLAAVGTLLLFYSAAGLWLRAARRSSGYYYKGLNLFVVRQLASRIKSNFIVLTVICAMLTVSLCTISVGVSMALAINDLAEQDAPYNLAVLSTRPDIDGDGDIAQGLKRQYGLDIGEYIADSCQISIRSAGMSYAELFAGQRLDLWDIDADLPQSSVVVVSISDFNRAMALQGKPGYTLPAGCYLLNCNYKGTARLMRAAAENAPTLKIGGMALAAAKTEPLNECYYMNSIGNNDRGTIIVPDEAAAQLQTGYTILLAQYAPGADTAALLQALLPIGLDDAHGYRYAERDMMYDMYFGSNALLALICCYVGLVFMLACVALLALKQLTDTADNCYRYGVLQKLGADSGMLSSALARQIGVFFALPLLPGCLYAVYITGKAVDLVEYMMNLHIATNMAVTAALYLVIYGGYYLITCISCLRIVSERRAVQD